MKKVLIIIGSILLVCLLAFIGLWIYFATKLDVDKITNVDQTVVIYDQNDTMVTSVYSTENRVPVEIDNIPDHVTNAFLAIEDARFYSHIGIDPIRIVGAGISNLTSGSIVQGGSTITQQLIKLSHLSADQTLARKIEEMFLALELERQYSKDEILEMYLNFCYFGNGAYGIEASANKYFDTNTANLTISQSAMLAGILKSPSNYAPHIEYDNSIERRNLVLEQMLSNEFITQEEYDIAINEVITIVESTEEVYPHGYYMDTVLNETEEIMNMDQEDLLKQGYSIYTTLDVGIQQTIEESAKTELPTNEDGEMPQVSIVSMADDGAIVGLVGGREYEVRQGFNRATQMETSPGSAIKPILDYAPAYEYNGLTNATMHLDQQKSFGNYSPSNASDTYRGWITTREALAYSSNIPAVQTLNDTGIETAKAYAQSVGIEFHESDDHLALALGGFYTGVSPVELSAAYVPFMNGGYYNESYTIRKIVDSSGETVYERDVQGEEVLSEETAFLITDVLKDVVEYGTGKRLNSLDMNIAGKTGTSTTANNAGNKDAWMVSYTTDYVTTAWIGYDDGSALPSGISGGSYPSQLVESFYLHVYGDEKPEDFTVPENVVEVSLDKIVLEEENKAVLANTATPSNYILREYFTKDTVPGEQSNNYTDIESIDGFSVTLNGEGYPTITFDSKYDLINYDIIRVVNGSEEIIFSTPGKDTVISYTDKSAEFTQSYTYYVRASYSGTTIESSKVEITPSPPTTTTTQTTQTTTETTTQPTTQEPQSTQNVGTHQRE